MLKKTAFVFLRLTPSTLGHIFINHPSCVRVCTFRTSSRFSGTVAEILVIKRVCSGVKSQY